MRASTNPVDEAHAALAAAGWSLGEFAVSTSAGIRFIVEGVNGENVIRAEAPTLAEAFHFAAQQAGALGMLRPRPCNVPSL
jgi:hypothetical protein